MPEKLEDIILAEIAARGPMRIDRFMELALAHPQHGYYMKRDPFGAQGDFVTAPEISQLFGEMLGAWAVDVWEKAGRPAVLTLLECGPGRGTLMADMMRVAGAVPDFLAACRIHLLETSRVLKNQQADRLRSYNVTWHEDAAAIPRSSPVIIIANEFWDALPVRQLQYNSGAWAERAIGIGPHGLDFTTVAAGQDCLSLLPANLTAPAEGDILEVSPARDHYAASLFSLLRAAGGAALIIDYGHARSSYGDTLQALYRHEYCPPLRHIGDADLTAHVDFAALARGAEGLGVFGPVSQGRFLKNLGVAHRAAILEKKADDRQKQDIKNALRRLTDDDEMGALFKVMGFTPYREIDLAGF